MQKIFTLFLSIWALGITCVEAQDIATRFVAMPDSLLPHVSINNRKDLIDLYKAGLRPCVAGKLSQETCIEEYDTHNIVLRLSPVATIQICSLPVADSALIAVIHTIEMPAKDSRIAFYTRNWDILESTPIFTVPDVSQFITCSKKRHSTTIRLIGNILPLHYRIADNTLHISHSLKEILPAETYQKVEPQLKSDISYKWTGKKFKRVKN